MERASTYLVFSLTLQVLGTLNLLICVGFVLWSIY